MVCSERAGDERPGGTEVGFAVLGEEGCKGGFFCEGARGVVGGGKGIDLGRKTCQYVIWEQKNRGSGDMRVSTFQ